MDFLGLLWTFLYGLGLFNDCRTGAKLVSQITAARKGKQYLPSNSKPENLSNPRWCCRITTSTQLLQAIMLALPKLLFPLQWVIVVITMQQRRSSLLNQVSTPQQLLDAFGTATDAWELTALVFITFTISQTIWGPAWVIMTTCSEAATHIIVLSWVVGIFTVITSARLELSVFETFLVFVPCSASVAASLGLLWHGPVYVDKAPVDDRSSFSKTIMNQGWTADA